MKSIVVLLTLFSLCQGQNADGCPKGWIRVGGIDRCYYISDNVDTFDGANKFCKDRKSQLAPTLTCEAYTNLIEALVSYRANANCPKGQDCDEFWIGIHDLTDSNWRTGNDLLVERNLQCQHWAKGYPRGSKTCGIMSLRGTWKRGVWKNVDCTSRFKYVCITCPNGFDYVPEINECLYFNLNVANWSDAQKNCAKMNRGAHLMSIHDSTKQKALEKYMQLQLTRKESDICLQSWWPEAGRIMWLGGQTKVPDNCITPYVWKQVGAPDIPFTYVKWFPGMPNCAENRENCAILTTSPRYDFHWEDVRCQILLCSLCEF